jgi:hypothetical protein
MRVLQDLEKRKIYNYLTPSVCPILQPSERRAPPAFGFKQEEVAGCWNQSSGRLKALLVEPRFFVGEGKKKLLPPNYPPNYPRKKLTSKSNNNLQVKLQNHGVLM